MGMIIEKTVTMTADDWRKMGTEAEHLAVASLHDENSLVDARSSRLKGAAQLLEAAKTFYGRANMMDMTHDVDAAVVDVWDLSDEQEDDPDEPAWPRISARLRDVAGADPQLLPMVEQIDRLHCLAIEKGLPQITIGQLESELARPAPNPA